MTKFFSNLPLVLAFRGVIAILLGVVALVWPGISLSAFIAVFGAFALVDGVTALVAAIANSNPIIPRWVLALDGAAGIAAGVVTFLWPDITALALLYLIAIWSLTTGALVIGAAISGLRFEPAWLMVLDGVISVVFGIALVAYPGSGILAIVWTLGIFAIFSGSSMLGAAFRLNQGASAVKNAIGGPVRPSTA
jgi:uncharacterized membrane protein HdeD (DUF308 family)